MRALKCLFAGILGAVLVLAAAAITIPTYGDYRNRAALDETIGKLDEYRQQIARMVSNHGPMGQSGVEFQISPEDASRLTLDYVRVFADGTIVFRHAKYGQVVVWEPSVVNGKVEWKCIGGPRHSVPRSCR